jgi:hypothetical protein
VSVEASNALTARWAAHLDGTSTVLSGASVYPLLALLAQAAHAPAPQAAMATFTADGFKAAAITALAMAAGSMLAHERRSRKLRVQVTFDRPFGFVAVHRPTGLILVAGWVAEPEEASLPGIVRR